MIVIIPRHLFRRGFERVSKREFHCNVDRTMTGSMVRNQRHYCSGYRTIYNLLVYRKGVLYFINNWSELEYAFIDRDVAPLTYFAELQKYPHLLIGEMPKEQMWRILDRASEGVRFNEIMKYEIEWVRRQCNGVEKIYKVGDYEKEFTSVEEWTDYVTKN